MTTKNDTEKFSSSVLTTLRKSFDGAFLSLVAIAIACGLAVWFFKGPETFAHAVGGSYDLMFFVLPRLSAAMLIAAFIQLFIPKELISRLIGEKAGMASIFIATVAGALTPGGPLTCFPIVVALYTAGANSGALVAYLTAWAMLGVQRIFAWEIPLLGEEIALFRIIASAPLPILAGMIAYYLPIRIRIREQGRMGHTQSPKQEK
jgi:uncharacterized membrane protein YraQ (UPF0718 family)